MEERDGIQISRWSNLHSGNTSRQIGSSLNIEKYQQSAFHFKKNSLHKKFYLKNQKIKQSQEALKLGFQHENSELMKVPKLVKKKRSLKYSFPQNQQFSHHIRNQRKTHQQSSSKHITPQIKLFEINVPLQSKKCGKSSTDNFFRQQRNNSKANNFQKEVQNNKDFLMKKAVNIFNLYQKLHNDIGYRSKSLLDKKISPFHFSDKKKKNTNKARTHSNLVQIQNKIKNTRCFFCDRSFLDNPLLICKTELSIQKNKELCYQCYKQNNSRYLLNRKKEFSLYLMKKIKDKYSQPKNYQLTQKEDERDIKQFRDDQLCIQMKKNAFPVSQGREYEVSSPYRNISNLQNFKKKPQKGQEFDEKPQDEKSINEQKKSLCSSGKENENSHLVSRKQKNIEYFKQKQKIRRSKSLRCNQNAFESKQIHI